MSFLCGYNGWSFFGRSTLKQAEIRTTERKNRRHKQTNRYCAASGEENIGGRKGREKKNQKNCDHHTYGTQKDRNSRQCQKFTYQQPLTKHIEKKITEFHAG